MAMNFWEAQRRARSKTKIYLFLFIAITLTVAFLAELTMRSAAGNAYNQPVPFIALAFITVTFLVAFFNYWMYSKHGGSYVAESMGATRLSLQKANSQEKQLLNIVEEMALASGQPMPAVYIIDAKQMNAFAAGMTSDNSAIAITRGALNRLSREEIQGVIAHEFGHIYNGDMRISLNLAAMIMGFFFVFYLGLRILQVSGMRRSSRSQKGGNPVALAALIFLIAGILTWIAGSILKACVSREREYLADACAVQFTRNPNGIAGALKKIAGESVNDMPKEGSAYSHMYFDEHLGFSALFATHPPIEKRIAAIEGKKYTMEEI